MSPNDFNDMARFVAMADEPRIQINGRALTDAQSMAIRVAVTMFHSETGTEESRNDLGPIADAYHARLGEVLKVMLNL